MPRANGCYNIAELQSRARARLPEPLYDYIVGGADDEKTLRANVEAFDAYQISASYVRDVRNVSTERTILGRKLAWPLILAPTGMTRLFHQDGEIAVAREAEKAGVGYSLSTMATTSIEEIGQANNGLKLFQLYLFKDDALNRAIIDRCRDAGFDAICLTVDCIVAGNRERDLRNGLTVPPKLSLATMGKFARRPAWCLEYMFGRRFSLPNVGLDSGGDVSTLSAFFAANMEPNITWQAIERLAAYWGGPFAVKGLQTAADARLAVKSGASAVIVSNHGGRQLDGVPATIDLLPEIVDAIAGTAEVILDGGIRRGAHILKALALGATACMAGRPYLFGISAFGAPGVERALQILRDELNRSCALAGYSSIDELNRDILRRATGLSQIRADNLS